MVDTLIFPHPLHYVLAFFGAITIAIILAIVIGMTSFYFELKYKDSTINKLIDRIAFLYTIGKDKLLWNKKRS